MKRKRLIAIGLIVTLSASVTACQKDEAVQEITKVAVEVQNPQSGELTMETSYIGTISPQEEVYVIPKTSGTITDTFVEVGDTVQEGDVLFKIDDETAQLQLASAQASYDSASLGLDASTGGARHLQNYQTEAGISTMYGNLEDLNEGIDDLEDAYSDIKNNIDDLEEGIASAQSQYATASAEETRLKAEYDAAVQERDRLKLIYDEAAASASSSVDIPSSDDASGEGTDGEGEDSESDSSAEPDNSAVADARDAYLAAASKATEAENAYNKVAGSSSGLQSSIAAMQTQLASLRSQKSSVKSSITSTENSRDQLQGQISQSSYSYEITQNEVYPQSDAASQAQLGAASVGVESAQLLLDYCTVTAPISGVVESFTAEENGMAAAGNVFAIISNKDSMTVTFHATEKARNNFKEGDRVTVERNGQTFEGNITEIGTMADSSSKLFQIKAAITNAGDSLPNGVSVKVYATTQREQSDLIIPYDSVYFSAGEAYVYCVEDNKLVKTPVTIGMMTDTQVTVEEGLSPDSLLVDNWSSKLRDGAEVEVVSINGEAVQSEEVVPEETPAEEAAPAEEEAAPEEEEAPAEEESPEEAEMTEEES